MGSTLLAQGPNWINAVALSIWFDPGSGFGYNGYQKQYGATVQEFGYVDCIYE